jgi:protein tyrosine phosphatase (PTP) superfamily phosphohydrolase (DUF442 family)
VSLHLAQTPWSSTLCETAAKPCSRPVNDQTEGPQTKALKEAATKAGLPVIDFTETLPEGQNYLQWMNTNVDHIDKTLQG